MHRFSTRCRSPPNPAGRRETAHHCGGRPRSNSALSGHSPFPRETPCTSSSRSAPKQLGWLRLAPESSPLHPLPQPPHVAPEVRLHQPEVAATILLKTAATEANASQDTDEPSTCLLPKPKNLPKAKNHQLLTDSVALKTTVLRRTATGPPMLPQLATPESPERIPDQRHGSSLLCSTSKRTRKRLPLLDACRRTQTPQPIAAWFLGGKA